MTYTAEIMKTIRNKNRQMMSGYTARCESATHSGVIQPSYVGRLRVSPDPLPGNTDTFDADKWLMFELEGFDKAYGYEYLDPRLQEFWTENYELICR